MKDPLPSNRNLSIHRRSSFENMPVQNFDNGLITEYLDKAYHVIGFALDEYPRTTAIRIDLCIPLNIEVVGQSLISNFFASLKAQISADLNKKEREVKRVHSCNLRYIWVKEKNEALNYHYHVVLFFNGHAYKALGDYKALSGNMAARIKKAWARALRYHIDDIDGLVHFPKNNTYSVNKNGNSYQDELNALFYRISYLAKVDTKVFNRAGRSFGCSIS